MRYKKGADPRASFADRALNCKGISQCSLTVQGFERAEEVRQVLSDVGAQETLGIRI